MKIPSIPTFRPPSRLSLERYIYISTLVGIFSAAATYRIGVDILLFYFILLSNLLLMLFVVDVNRIPIWLILLGGYLGFSGMYGIAHGTDSVGMFAKQFIGITITALYFCYFFRLPGNNIYRSFRAYTVLAYWACLIGFPIWIVSCFLQHKLVRLQSICTEPAAFCILVLPAYYWYAASFLRHKRHAREFVVFTLAVALSGSSVGFLGATFGVLLLLSKHRGLLLAAPVILGILVGTIYSVSSDFRLRMNDTLYAMTSNELSGVNVSTYAVITNLIVTERVFEQSPVLGNGLGSHPLSYEKYIGLVEGADTANGDWLGYNSTDADSMAFRSLSELGLVGLGGMLLFLWYFHVGGQGEHAVISNAILVSFFMKLFRSGLYFPPEQFFFICIYFMNYRQHKLSFTGRVAQGVTQPGSRMATLFGY